ncbi:MAG: twin-arginine translocase subunit TatC [Calditrichia bacterium]
MSDVKEMTFLDHLEEFRGRLFKIMIGVLITTIGSFFVSDYITDFLLYPAKAIDNPLDLQVLTVQGMFMVKLEVSLITGIILAIPIIVYQLWQFISPGLYPHEKKYFPYVMITTTSLMLIGISFAYFLVIPLAITFLTKIGPDYVKFNVSINAYFSFIIRLCLIFGFIFEMPLMSFILARFGILSSSFLKKYRRHAIVAIFMLAAIFTPPDIFTQILMAIPLTILYEISIFIVKRVEKKKSLHDSVGELQYYEDQES